MRLRSVLEGLRHPVSTVRGLRIRTQYVLVLFAILLVLGSVVVGTAQFFQQQTIEQEEESLEETATLAAEQIDESIRALEDRLVWKGTQFETNLTNREAILDRTVENTGFLIALVTDSDGIVQEMRGDIGDEAVRNETIGSDLSGEGYIARALDNESAIQEPEQEADGQLTLAMAAPIHVDQSLEGVVAGAVLIGEEGGLGDAPTVHGFFRPIEPLDTRVQSASVTQETADGTLTVHTAGDSFDDGIASRATVDSTGWTVTVEQDRGALTDRLQALQYLQFGSLFVVLLSIVGLGFYQYRTNLRQTGRLLDGFEGLSGGDFGHRLDFSGAKEWEQISDGFNEMAAGLRERENAIREREAQIREREQRLSVLNRILRHNLQNDMTVIMGHAQLVPEVDSQEQREAAAEKIVETARNLVDHSKKARQLETIMENAENEPVTLDLATELERLVETVGEEYPSTTIEIDIPDRVAVSAVTGLEFGLESLLENACQHADDDDPIVGVDVEEDGPRISITFRDNGPGIPEHEQKVLRQTEETSLEHGSGIGLWLAFWAAVKSQGTLTFGDQEDGGAVTVSLMRADSR